MVLLWADYTSGCWVISLDAEEVEHIALSGFDLAVNAAVDLATLHKTHAFLLKDDGRHEILNSRVWGGEGDKGFDLVELSQGAKAELMRIFNLNELLDDLDELGNKDWGDSLEFIKIHPKAVEKAKLFVESHSISDLGQPYVVPMMDGGINIEWYLPKRELEIEFNGDGRILYLTHDRVTDDMISDYLDLDAPNLVFLFEWLREGVYV